MSWAEICDGLGRLNVRAEPAYSDSGAGRPHGRGGYSDETVYTVEVTRPDPAAGPQTSAPVSLTRRETSRLSILPGARVPVPGGSGERSWGTDSAIHKTGEKMLAACVEAAAQALARREPSAWRKAGEPPPAPAPDTGKP